MARISLTRHLRTHVCQIIDLEDMARALIKNYYRMSKRQPARLLFFRDGVSEGQFDEVCRREIAAIKGACMLHLSQCPDFRR